MERYLAGDHRAFDEIFRRYGPRLFGWFRRSALSDAVSHDLVQQTFLHFHRARADFRPGAAVRPWLFAIGANVRREYFRKYQRLARERPLDDAPEPAQAPDVAGAEQRAVRRALESLPDASREVVVLHWYEGFTFAEIGDLVGASTSAVKVRAHRAYRKLRDVLGGGV